ncbi:hypothetical protein [Sphingomonas nostoxanthinifaciens]|nr:hypothetical protein [Sphingomonas nostoxanthinifaciens]
MSDEQEKPDEMKPAKPEDAAKPRGNVTDREDDERQTDTVPPHPN